MHEVIPVSLSLGTQRYANSHHWFFRLLTNFAWLGPPVGGKGHVISG